MYLFREKEVNLENRKHRISTRDANIELKLDESTMQSPDTPIVIMPMRAEKRTLMIPGAY